MYARTALQAVLVFLFSFQLSFVFATPTLRTQGIARRAPTSASGYETNAKRFAAGLPPLPPKRRFTPSRVGVAARAPSAVPFSGFLRIDDFETGSNIGWVSKTLLGGQIRSTPGGGQNRLPISFNFVSSGTPFDMPISDGDDFHYLGAAGGSLTGPSTTNVNPVVRTNSIPAGSGPMNVGNSGADSGGPGASESVIWKYNPSGSEFTSEWVNPDFILIATYFYLSNGPGNRFLYISSNPDLGEPEEVTRVRVFLDLA
ncbi:hypothetical protein D9611_011824 [Ephemerocybe angulata]|uniref:Uncharacterized protein n=1 Tax=Ephemerocybe angulata TaxID=980116 RepID=A0A8H5BZU5_9AGAR|nr:hypothetical protein D9611_011824 [Tulosesus angulatus]